MHASLPGLFYNMRSVTTRLFILITALLIAVIIGMQVHWLRKTYKYEENEFNTSVLKAVRGVYEDMPMLYNQALTLDNQVEKYHNNGFIFQIRKIPQQDSLQRYLSGELEDFKVFTDCKIAVYDAALSRYAYDGYLSTDGSRNGEDTVNKLPVLKRDFHYVHLFFPNRGKYIISQMKNWIFASFILLLLLVGFSFSVYYFYQQKFLVEVQKDFINNVTHEFSTPLSVIEISLEGLQKPAVYAQPEKHRKYVESIKYQADYLKAHITNLIKTVVAGNYHFGVSKRPVVPNELLRRAVAQLEPLLSKSNGVVEWKLEEADTAINADEDNLYLALFNIINNAIKYSSQPRITILTTQKDNKFIISIKDNGMGIEASQIKKIFRKFYRVQQGNVHTAKGLGLGLYFTKKVIQGHGGHIYVNSIPDVGTEFLIELPGKIG